VEFVTAVFSLGLYWRYGFSPVYFFFLAFTAALLVVSLIDLDYQIIPDEISLPGILVGLAGSFWNPLVTPMEAFLGALAGAGALYLVAEFYYFLTRREGLGGGDLKLLALIGSFLGLRSLFPVIFVSSLIGAVVGIAVALRQRIQNKRHLAIPFGPFLSLGALVYLFFPQFFSLLFTPWFPGKP
jgi:leader peptidase (prepilin peptidase)/N-methyltransferase